MDLLQRFARNTSELPTAVEGLLISESPPMSNEAIQQIVTADKRIHLRPTLSTVRRVNITAIRDTQELMTVFSKGSS